MKTPNKFDYYESLANGKKSEAEFKNKFCVKLEASPEWAYDFYMPSTQGLQTVELKNDNYKSGNFAMERYRDVTTKADGGPWQSKSRYFIYFFKKLNTYYLFETKDLVKALDALITNPPYALRSIQTETTKSGHTYRSESILVPIELLKDVGMKFSDEHLKAYKTSESDGPDYDTLTNGYFKTEKTQRQLEQEAQPQEPTTQSQKFIFKKKA